MFAQRTGLLVNLWHVSPFVAPGQEEDAFVRMTHRQGKRLFLRVMGRCVIMQGAPQVAEIYTLHQRAFPINDDCLSQFRFPTRCLIKMYSLLALLVFSILICWHSQNCWIATLPLGMQCLYCRKEVFYQWIHNLFPPITSVTNVHHDRLQLFNICHLVL